MGVALIYIAPVLYAVLLWALSTYLLIWLNQWPLPAARAVVVGGAPLVVLLSGQIAGEYYLSDTGAPYLGFAAGILVYSWHELALFTGLLTGPRPRALPPHTTGWRRIWYACGTHLYHDLGLALSIAALALLDGDGAHCMAMWTMVVLWVMQHSAKLNVLFGVRNFQAAWLPPHLNYLASYWRAQPSNPFFGPSLIGATGLTVLCAQQALTLPPGGPATGLMMLAALSALAVLEHCLLVIPWPVPAPR